MSWSFGEGRCRWPPSDRGAARDRPFASGLVDHVQQLVAYSSKTILYAPAQIVPANTSTTGWVALR